MNGTESNIIGSGYNPVDGLPKNGKRTLGSDHEVSIDKNEVDLIIFILNRYT